MSTTHTKVSNPLSEHSLTVMIRSQPSLSKGQRTLLKKMFNGGANIPKALWYRCRVAEDVKEAVGDGLIVDGDVYRLNPAVSPHLGKNSEGKGFLTFGLIRESDQKKLTFKWVGDAVPHVMQERAVKHDLGLKTSKVVVSLNFEDAVVWDTNARSKRADSRDGRHDVSPQTGKLYPRKKVLNGKRPHAQRFDRIGQCDLNNP